MLHIRDLHLLNQGKDIKKNIHSKLDFASERDERNFYASMGVIAKIYHALKDQPCHEAPPECIARIIAPSICNPAQHIELTDLRKISQQSNDAADLTNYILENWHRQQADRMASGSPAG